jgi:hypothetical protein
MAIKRLVNPTNWRARRRTAYPPVEDQLDALWKQLNEDRLGGKQLIAEADAVLNRILAVKRDIPKPE